MTRLMSHVRVGSALLLASFLVVAFTSPLGAQTAPKPKPAAPAPPRAPARPPARTPAPKPAPSTAAAKPAEPTPPPKPVVLDVRMKTVYTADDQKTESATYRKGERERFEFGEVVLIKQPDLKRTVQIMRAANTYMLIPDAAPPAAPPVAAAASNAPPQTPGVIMMTTTITDTGERKTMFGLQARHAKMTIDRQPAGVACDPSKQHIETDGWYVDLPVQMQTPTVPEGIQPPPPAGCVDEIKAAQNGDPKVLGFPVSYATTISGEDGKPNVVAMEVTELELTTLDATLFDIPPGLSEAGNLQALTRAVSDANETKLAQELAASTPSVQKTPGVFLVGVPEVVNKTAQQVERERCGDAWSPSLPRQS